MLVRHVEIENFRALSELSWFPKPGVNCLVSPGDSGKSTILDAIDLAAGARRQYVFSDSDFQLHDISQDMDIKITICQLNNDLMDIDRYGHYHRGYNSANPTITDKPLGGTEVVL